MLETFQYFPNLCFSPNAGPGIPWQAYELADISQRNQVDKFEFLSKFVRNSSYFEKIFNNAHCSPLVQGVKSLASGPPEGSILKGKLLTSSEENSGESFREKGKFGRKVNMGELRV